MAAARVAACRRDDGEGGGGEDGGGGGGEGGSGEGGDGESGRAVGEGASELVRRGVRRAGRSRVCANASSF